MTSPSPSRTGKQRGRPAVARDRIMRAAYDLFLKHGVRATGIDAIIVAADVARMTFYRTFGAKDELVLAFLAEHERRWTEEWLTKEVRRRHEDPKDRLLGMFDLFHEWFQQRRFDGCPFIRTLIEAAPGTAAHRAAAQHLATVQLLIEGFAKDAGIKDTGDFAAGWHMLLKGAIVAASQGNRNAARNAKRAATLMLAAWGKRSARTS